MGKNFFYRVNPNEVLAELIFVEDREKWMLEFFDDLRNDDPEKARSEISKRIITEAHNFREKRSMAGKASAEQKANKGQHDSTYVEHVSTSVQQSSTSNSSSNSKEESIPYKEILQILNTETKNNYRLCDSLRKLVHARWMEGFRLEDFRHVILAKSSQWKDDPKWCNYLRPETLFSNKFNSYRQEKITESKEDWRKGYLLGY